MEAPAGLVLGSNKTGREKGQIASNWTNVKAFWQPKSEIESDELGKLSVDVVLRR